jgi:hypothetical protein
LGNASEAIGLAAQAPHRRSIAKDFTLLANIKVGGGLNLKRRTFLLV